MWRLDGWSSIMVSGKHKLQITIEEKVDELWIESSRLKPGRVKYEVDDKIIGLEKGYQWVYHKYYQPKVPNKNIQRGRK